MALSVLLLLGLVTVTGSTSVQAAQSDLMVSANPVDYTPQVQNGEVKSLVQIGTRIFVGGSFTQVKEAGSNKPLLTRNRMFSFDANTGQIDDWAPSADKGEVSVLLPAPDGQSVYAGGSFGYINGIRTFVLAKLNTATGQPITSFTPQLSARVKDLRLAGGRLYVAGDFATVSGVARKGLTALNPVTGAKDDFVDLGFSGQHNGGVTYVGKMDVSPDGSRLVAIGNFTTVGGQSRPQIVMIDLTGAQAQLSNWATVRYNDFCSGAWNSYMQDIDFAPDGSYFVVSTTATAGGTSKLCDSQARWENVAAGSGRQPTWVTLTGGDTTYAVEVTDNIIYVGGHFRWSNNPFGADFANQGAVDRQGLVALDPLNGLPLSWNPGRTRGVGVFDLLITSHGLWIGSDTDEAGGETHQKLAMFPNVGGTKLPTITTGTLPGTVYYAGSTSPFGQNFVKHRSFTGTTTGSEVTDATGGVDWRTARGSFMIGGVLYHGAADGQLYSRTYDGTTFGAASRVSGADQIVNMHDWHNQVKSITGMFYSQGRIYYTRGQNNLYYRGYSPESRVVSAQEFVAAANFNGVNWSQISGMFVDSGKLYYVSTVDGQMRTLTFNGGVPSGTPTVVSTADWRARSLFLYNGVPNRAPQAAFSSTCDQLDCSFNGSASADPDGTLASYAWTFGDGSTATGATPTHNYAAAGTYTVTLTVTDNRGGTDQVTQTVTVSATQAQIGFRGTDGFNANATEPTVTVPPSVGVGDGLVLILTLNSAGLTVTPPAGWTQVDTQSTGAAVSTVWKKVAGAGDAGRQVSVGLSAFAKVDLRLLAYSSTNGTTPISVAAKALDPATATVHTTPTATVSGPGSWVVSYWGDKSSTTTEWTAPASVTTRATSYGVSSGRVTSLVADSGGTVPTGPYGGLPASTDAASRAMMWTIVLTPQS